MNTFPHIREWIWHVFINPWLSYMPLINTNFCKIIKLIVKFCEPHTRRTRWFVDLGRYSRVNFAMWPDSGIMLSGCRSATLAIYLNNSSCVLISWYMWMFGAWVWRSREWFELVEFACRFSSYAEMSSDYEASALCKHWTSLKNILLLELWIQCEIQCLTDYGEEHDTGPYTALQSEFLCRVRIIYAHYQASELFILSYIFFLNRCLIY